MIDSMLCIITANSSYFAVPLSYGVFFFKQKTAYDLLIGLVGSEMCIRDSFRLLGYLDELLHGDRQDARLP